jgi:3-keto-5-aminohexanoate cleavage enzyme
MEKLIITAAITGGVHGKTANSNLPEQPEEQIEQTIEAWKAGASVVHIHARDKDGKGSQDPEIYRKVKEGIQKRGCDIVINFTTGGTAGMTPEERLRSTEAGPDIASLNMGTINWGPLPDGTYYLSNNPPNELEWYARTMRERGVKPELEVYSPSMMKDVYQLIKKGLLEKPCYINFVLGVPGQNTMEATWQNLVHCVSLLPLDSLFNVCALAVGQLPMTSLSILLGGMARVGMEDNIHYAKGQLVKSNAQLVERTVRIAKELQREIATPDEARRILGLKKLS